MLTVEFSSGNAANTDIVRYWHDTLDMQCFVCFRSNCSTFAMILTSRKIAMIAQDK